MCSSDLNNKLVRALLADQASWEEATYPEDVPAPVAYAPALQPIPQS